MMKRSELQRLESAMAAALPQYGERWGPYTVRGWDVERPEGQPFHMVHVAVVHGADRIHVRLNAPDHLILADGAKEGLAQAARRVLDQLVASKHRPTLVAPPRPDAWPMGQG